MFYIVIFAKGKNRVSNSAAQKRKVGAVIIMHPGHNNYGTSLQGFATIKVIQKLGYSLRIIRYNKKRTFKEVATTFIGLMRSGVLNVIYRQWIQKRIKKKYSEYTKAVEKRTIVVNRFKAKYFDSISDFYTGYDTLCEGSKNYDVIFVGSDQVWGPLSLYSRFYNLLFVNESVPQFSYASSFGQSYIFDWQKEGTSKYLNKMDAIGVREIRGKEIVEELSQKNATVVADPTLLLTRQDWENVIVDSKAEIRGPYILSYVLGPRKDVRKTIMELGQRTGLKVLAFRHMDWYEPADEVFGDVPIYDADCLDFVKLLKNSTFVCTDSFHCTLFSIIFQKKFLTFYRVSPTEKMSSHSRIDSILNVLGLQSRLFADDAYTQIQKDIDYLIVDARLEVLRNESLVFLKNSLELEKV